VNLGTGNTNVGRDQVITLAGDIDALGAALRGLPLTEAGRAEAARQLAAFHAAADREDKPRASTHLSRFTKVLKDAGALAAAGASLIEPLTRIGRWLGPLGAAVLTLL
jgi:hypothetical protein